MIHKEFLESFRLMRKRPLLVSLSCAIDILSLYLYFVAASLALLAAEPIFSDLGNIMSDDLSILASDAVASSAFISLFWDFVMVFIVFSLSVFLLYALTQGTSWYIASLIKGHGKKMWDWKGYLSYLMRFSLVSSVFFVSIVVVSLLSFRYSISTLFQKEAMINILLGLFILVSLMMAFSSYSNMKKGIFKAKTLFFGRSYLKFIVSVALIVAIDLFARALSSLIGWGIIWNFALVALLLLPAVSFARIFMIEAS